jgi:hypothetical protein
MTVGLDTGKPGRLSEVAEILVDFACPDEPGKDRLHEEDQSDGG